MRIPRGSAILERPQPKSLVPEPGFARPEASGTSLAAVPQTYPAGPTYDSFLYAQLQGAVFPGQANVFTQPQTFSTINVGTNLWSITADNTGTPGHTTSGPNLYFDRLNDGWGPLTIRSIGQLAVDLKDATLPNNGVSHAFQVRRTVVGTPQIGVGTGIQFFVTDAAGIIQQTGNVQNVLTDLTTGAISSYINLCCYNAGAFVEALRAFNTGEVRALSAGGFFSNVNLPGSTQYGNFSSGSGGFSGLSGHFAGAAGGTHYAANAAAGFTGNFADFQQAGVSKLAVSNLGAVLAAGPFGGNLNPFQGWFTQITPSVTPEADYTLSPAESQGLMLQINTGNWTGAHNVIVPGAIGGLWFVRNASTQIVTVKTASGTGIAIGAGKFAILGSPGGVNILRWTPDT